MSLTERERMILHITQLTTSKSNGNLDMTIGSAVNYLLNERARSLSREEIGEILHDCEEELTSSAIVYEEHNIC